MLLGLLFLKIKEDKGIVTQPELDFNGNVVDLC
jgi:hypothetical protein